MLFLNTFVNSAKLSDSVEFTDKVFLSYNFQLGNSYKYVYENESESVESSIYNDYKSEKSYEQKKYFLYIFIMCIIDTIKN